MEGFRKNKASVRQPLDPSAFGTGWKPVLLHRFGSEPPHVGSSEGDGSRSVLEQCAGHRRFGSNVENARWRERVGVHKPSRAKSKAGLRPALQNLAENATLRSSVRSGIFVEHDPSKMNQAPEGRHRGVFWPSRAFDQMPLLTELEVVSLRVSTKIPPLTGLPRWSCLVVGVPLSFVGDEVTRLKSLRRIRN